MAFLFLVLVCLARLQLHLIPTGKPSSGTDFRALGPGFKKRGDWRLVPFWGTGLFFNPSD